MILIMDYQRYLLKGIDFIKKVDLIFLKFFSDEELKNNLIQNFDKLSTIVILDCDYIVGYLMKMFWQCMNISDIIGKELYMN